MYSYVDDCGALLELDALTYSRSPVDSLGRDVNDFDYFIHADSLSEYVRALCEDIDARALDTHHTAAESATPRAQVCAHAERDERVMLSEREWRDQQFTRYMRRFAHSPMTR